MCGLTLAEINPRFARRNILKGSSSFGPHPFVITLTSCFRIDLEKRAWLRVLLGTFSQNRGIPVPLRSKYDTCVENPSGRTHQFSPGVIQEHTLLQEHATYITLHKEPCNFSEIAHWNITHLNLSIPGSALRTSSTIRIVTGREAIAVKKPLECRFATQSLTSSSLCWWSQDEALSIALITVKLLSCESLRYTFLTWTWAVTWLFFSRDNLVISPVNAT